MKALDSVLAADGPLTIAGAPEGADVLAIADLARAATGALGGVPILHIARDDGRLETMATALGFFAPEIEVLRFPAWDCLPYDRVSPNAAIVAERIGTLARLATPDEAAGPRIVLTTVNAASQRVVGQADVRARAFSARCGETLDLEALNGFLTGNGYARAGTVTEPGDFAIRGGLVDLFPPGAERPLRLDLFGDELDTIRPFDPLTQRSEGRLETLTLLPASEFALDPDSIRRFRQGYLAAFGAVTDDDPLYTAINEGRMAQGAEHWLPLFHDGLETLFDYLPGAVVVLDHQTDDAAKARFDTIRDYFETRRETLASDKALAAPYKPLPPDALYLSPADWDDRLEAAGVRRLSPFEEPASATVVDLGGKRGRDFAPERAEKGANVYEALKGHLDGLRSARRRVVMVSYSAGARERLAGVLADHGIAPTRSLDRWSNLSALPRDEFALAVLPLAHGFVTADLAVITEQDVLGDRLVRKQRRTRRAENYLKEASALVIGDLVVHLDHGLGRFDGIKTITAAGAPHDCLQVTYADGDRLFVPVENIEVLSRYGSEDAEAALDKLGGSAWQKRKSKLKKRIREMAGALIQIAAARKLKTGTAMAPASGLYEEFCARFPYLETDDQARAIDDVLGDLGGGEPMDRLICGDVGFGKTEVALRSAFIAVMEGYQVAVVVPTTLLARQHYQTFTERFRGLPVRIEQLSRLVGTAEAGKTREGLADGQVDIVIGTHALLSKRISFKTLGLLIVDEEQHFGVAHKEKLKELKANVHVLTLTATPIPRTLQQAMTGIRDLSLIATPPVDRLAVRTFVTPFDEVVIREALLREHYRGGQSFYVCPRISDLDEAAAFLSEHVPEVSFVTAHGQMPPAQIEDVMSAFYDGRYDVLLSTSIVESGLDIPKANTLVVHRADRFGLAQLYQLRGRVGRSKLRAYAYLTVPAGRILTETAQRRLEVLQSLDSLGAGFTLASHDMDIRGAGNLLGEEQSGHIREVGVELYQQMLEEAVAEARGVTEAQEGFTPQINLGASVLIPEGYVPDLNLRMALYRRLAELTEREEIDDFAAELIDRFGPLPDEVAQLLAVIEIKAYCRRAGIARIEAGAKGATLSFHQDRFANPAGLVDFISSRRMTAKLRPDHKLVYLARWDDVEQRLAGVRDLARGLATVAEKADQAA